MKDECDTLMMQKFGCIVDIEKLEAVTFNRQIEEAKERLAVLETECYNELIEWDVSYLQSDLLNFRKDKINYRCARARTLIQFCSFPF